MDHETVAPNRVVERYLLGELPPAERDAFEAHYFDCEACATEVMAATEFMNATRAALAIAGGSPERAGKAAEVITPARRGWRSRITRAALTSPVSAAAAGILLVAVAYQGLVTQPGLERELEIWETPRAVPAQALLRPQTRGKPATVTLDPASPAIAFELEAPTGGGAGTSYQLEVRRADGKVVLPAFPLRAPPDGDPVSVILPRRRLGPGSFVLVLTTETTEIERYPFVLATE
jgi:hypothetical protein